MSGEIAWPAEKRSCLGEEESQRSEGARAAAGTIGQVQKRQPFLAHEEFSMAAQADKMDAVVEKLVMLSTKSIRCVLKRGQANGEFVKQR